MAERCDVERAYEGKVLECLADAWNLFLTLEIQHPDEQHEFRTALHRAQAVIAIRDARRYDSKRWPSPRQPASLLTEDNC
jgi:hypothetical protein